MKTTSLGSKVGGAASASGRVGKWTPPAPIDALAGVLPKPTLTAVEQKELTRLEGVIQKGWTTFLDVGSALLVINARRLYRDAYATFEDYCHERMGLSRPYAYSLIGSAEVNEQLSAIADIRVKPVTESQFRELIPVPETKRVAAWRGALKLAGGKPVTAKVVRQAAAEFKPKKAGRAGEKVKKSVTPEPSLKPAFKLLDELEKLVGKDSRLLGKVLALRECLEKLGGK